MAPIFVPDPVFGGRGQPPRAQIEARPAGSSIPRWSPVAQFLFGPFGELVVGVRDPMHHGSRVPVGQFISECARLPGSLAPMLGAVPVAGLLGSLDDSTAVPRTFATRKR